MVAQQGRQGHVSSMNAGAHILRKEDFPASVCREFFQPSPRPRACSRSRRYSCASFPSKMIMAPLFRLYCCGTSVHLLMMLGFAAGGRERQGFRLLVPTPTVPRIEAASNMDRFRPVLGGVGRTYLAAFAPPPQLIKVNLPLLLCYPSWRCLRRAIYSGAGVDCTRIIQVSSTQKSIASWRGSQI